MNLIIKSCQNYTKEKMGVFAIVLVALPSVFVWYFNNLLSYIILFTMILFHSFQMTHMLSNESKNCIHYGYYYYRKKRINLIFFASAFINSWWLVLLEAKMWKDIVSQPIFLIYIGILWFYLIVIGILIGLFLKHEVVGYAIIILFILFFITNFIIHEEYFRYVSPILLVGNRTMNIFNILGLILVNCGGVVQIVFFYNTVKKVKIISLFGLLGAMSILTFSEVQYENHLHSKPLQLLGNSTSVVRYNDKLDKSYVEEMSSILLQVNDKLDSYGFQVKAEEIQFQYNIFFPWDNKKELIFVTKSEDNYFINIYSDSLSQLSKEEFISKYIYGILDADSFLQDIAVELLIVEVTAQILTKNNSSYVMKFSYENEVEGNGKVTSPRQTLVVESLLNDSNKFSILYEELGRVNDWREINPELSYGDEFKEILLKILKG